MPVTAPAHHVIMIDQVTVAIGKTIRPCSRSSQFWPSAIGVNTFRQKLPSCGR